MDYVNVDDIFGYLSRGKGRGREVRSLPLGFCVPIPLFQKSDTPSWGGERGGGEFLYCKYLQIASTTGKGQIISHLPSTPPGLGGWVG